MAIYVYSKDSTSGNSTQGMQVQTFYSRIARRTIDQDFSFSKFCNFQDMMKQKSGETFKVSTYYWSIYRNVVADDGSYAGVDGGYISARDMKDIDSKLQSMTVTQEGVYNKSDIYQLGTFRKVTFETRMKKFAGIVELTEDAETYSEDAVRALTIEDVTKQMNLAYNDLIMKDILSSTFKVYGGDATSRGDLGGTDDSTAKNYRLTEALTTKVYGTLIENKAKPMARIIAGQNKIGTKPVPKSFYVVVGTRMHNALINKDLFPEFQSFEEYPDPSVRMVMDGLEEIGRIGRFRILFSELLPEYKHQGHLVNDDGENQSNTCWSSQDEDDDDKWKYDVAPIVVMSQDAISTVGLQGKTKHMIYTQFPEQIDGTNPIGERGYIAFKFRYASVITKPESLAVMEVVTPIA